MFVAKTGFLFFLLLSLFFLQNLQAQTTLKLNGVVQDTVKAGIPGANVRLISGKDTMNTSTDSVGRFSFTVKRSAPAAQVSILVRGLGYLPNGKEFTLSDDSREQALSALILKDASNQLSEVVIKAKVIPMRLMKDTVEFNAAAYTVREGDNVDELLKQLPGVEIDKDGNVSSGGKEMTKLRVNGKDFFTSNVKEFISQLPAGIVDKLQVIDDYGDKANFTGVKSGEPQKMLNLVLKDKRNRGTFGNAGLSGGTNNRYVANLHANVWRDDSQLGLNGQASNTNTGAGINNSSNTGFTFRDKVGKNLSLNGNYNFQRNRTELSQQNYIETVNSLGTVYNESSTQDESKGTNHNFDMGLQSVSGVNYLNGSIRGSLNNSESMGLTSSKQTGVIRQDLLNGNRSDQHSPNLNADFNMARHFKKQGRTVSVGLTAGNNISNSVQDQNNRIGYYDPETELLVKDSLRNQLVDTRNRVQNINASLTVTEPLGKTLDSVAQRNIDFSYMYAYTHTSNELVTNVQNDLYAYRRVDSLSNKYTSSFSTHTIGINYRYSTKGLNYSIGVTGQPNVLTGAYEGRADKISRTGFNVSPVARFDFTPSPKTTYSLVYNGNSNAPDFNQLQPVPDTRNLQNVIIGNPDLKASFNHSVNLSYRSVSPANGSTLQLSVRATAVQDQVVSNTVLIRDTLNSLKQETRYLNTGGNYNVGSNYFWSIPLSGKKFNIELKGGASYNRRVSYADNIKNFGKGLGLNQGLSLRMNQKWLMLSTSASYIYRSNVYSLATANSNVIQTWMFNGDAKIFIANSFNAGFNTSKTINQGFAIAGRNPLLMGTYVEKTFFKRKGSIKLEGHDLLNQGNNISRVVSDNSITESRNNQITRYFLLSLNWRLQSFPGMGGSMRRGRS
ncbi:outer membrane beta-barrel protein [Pedobacter sp. MC2016-15]|uniref:outer membrane beta-barrel protein n=1 Tax=Pedobacter sp. MC2016-15 TaxID=2994473 RepID=UPI002246AA8A|nr:outer membrane beta-barrel protein [Pedobacter sp. MC2016-15]MCX2480936.1 outer membrane beta-barrel protein [Pedobacter sp. MC2016-15]